MWITRLEMLNRQLTGRQPETNILYDKVNHHWGHSQIIYEVTPEGEYIGEAIMITHPDLAVVCLIEEDFQGDNIEYVIFPRKAPEEYLFLNEQNIINAISEDKPAPLYQLSARGITYWLMYWNNNKILIDKMERVNKRHIVAFSKTLKYKSNVMYIRTELHRLEGTYTENNKEYYFNVEGGKLLVYDTI